MAIKKSELYSSLWQSCDELRGGMDASQYKDYVLVLLFVKYVSDKYAGQRGALIEVPQGGGFADMVALKGDKEIGDKINKLIAKLAEANELRGVIDVADFNDADKLGKGKDMVDRLSNLVGIFEKLDFGRNRAEGDDLLGDAYEYLMRHFATESGKSKGQFYTPAEVSRIMAKVIGIGSAARATQPPGKLDQKRQPTTTPVPVDTTQNPNPRSTWNAASAKPLARFSMDAITGTVAGLRQHRGNWMTKTDSSAAVRQIDQNLVLRHRIRREARQELAKIVLADLCVLGHGARQETFSKRSISDRTDSKLFTDLENAVCLGSADPERVFVLQRADGLNGVGAANSLRARF